MQFDLKDKIERDSFSITAEEKKLKKSFYILGFVIAFIIIFSATLIIAGDGTNSFLKNIPLVGQLFSLNKGLAGESSDRVNVLLLGMGGEGHDGAYLTDTIMLTSLKPSTKEIAMFSIPRDLVVPVNGSWQKINSINAYAEAAKKDGSMEVVKNFSEIFNTPIDYYVRIDFEAFVNIIDALGGIEVNVENTLDDYRYPVEGQEDNPSYDARYEHLHVDKGLQKMNGTLALKYVRSRHGLGAEGSDFARARRQQLVLEAVKNRILQDGNFLRPGMISKIWNELDKHVSTNFRVWEIVRVWELFKDVQSEKIYNHVFSDGPGNFLAPATGQNGAYILVPKTNSFKDINAFIAGIFGGDTAAVEQKISVVPDSVFGTTSKPTSTIVATSTAMQAASVEVRNGTNINGLAGQVAFILRRNGFTINSIANASKRDLVKPMIYDLTFGAKKNELGALIQLTNASSTTILPEWLIADIKINTQSTRPDFILVTGQDSAR